MCTFKDECYSQYITDHCDDMNNHGEHAGCFVSKGSKEDMDKLKEKYYELIYAVEQKFPNETRHETALRYIMEAERCFDNTTWQARAKEDK